MIRQPSLQVGPVQRHEDTGNVAVNRMRRTWLVPATLFPIQQPGLKPLKHCGLCKVAEGFRLNNPLSEIKTTLNVADRVVSKCRQMQNAVFFSETFPVHLWAE